MSHATAARPESVSMLALDLPGLTCFVLNGEVTGVDTGAGPSASRPVVDLDALLGAGGARDGARELRLRGTTTEVRCLTAARLYLCDVSTHDLFAVPRVLQGGGCAPWIRGFVRLEGASETTGPALGLWLDSSALARSRHDQP